MPNRFDKQEEKENSEQEIEPKKTQQSE